MNIKDFYKELMKEYTFDSAKVRRFAKRSSAKGVRVSVKRWWHVPSTVAVAAASLALGTFTFFYNWNIGSPIPVTPPFLQNGEVVDSPEKAHLAKMSFSSQTLYLSFGNPVTLREIENTLYTISDTGNIVLEEVYVVDDSTENGGFVAVSVSDFSKIRNDSSPKIVAAKVSAPGRLIDEIERQSEIENVFIASEGVGTYEFIPSAVHESTAAVTGAVSEPVSTEPNPIDSVPIEKLLNLNISRVAEARFLDDTHFTVITPESAMLYQIGVSGEDESKPEILPISEFALQSHRTRFSATGDSALISGVESLGAKRRILLLADGKTGTLENVDISGILTQNDELVFAFYDDINERIIARTRSSGLSSVYIMDRNDPNTAKPILQEKSDAVVLALNGNALYYAESNDVYRYDFTDDSSVLLYAFSEYFLGADESVSFERNFDLSGFVVNYNGGRTARVFSAGTETLSLPAEVAGGLIFHRNSTDLLNDGENFYKLAGEKSDSLEIYTGTPTTVGEKSASTLYSVFEITDKSVRILLKN